METLSSIYRGARNSADNPMSKDEIRGINIRLLLLVQLSSLQINIAQEIEQCLRKHDAYNFKIKHNHKKIVDFIRGCGNSEFYKNLSIDQMVAMGEDADSLEDIVYRWCGLRQD